MVTIITREELKERIDNKELFKLLDVRDTPDYETEHIINAIHILISDMSEKSLSNLFEKSDLIITYSLDLNCPASGIAAEKLQKFGYHNVLRYKGGWKEWKDSKYLTE